MAFVPDWYDIPTERDHHSSPKVLRQPAQMEKWVCTHGDNSQRRSHPRTSAPTPETHLLGSEYINYGTHLPCSTSLWMNHLQPFPASSAGSNPKQIVRTFISHADEPPRKLFADVELPRAVEQVETILVRSLKVKSSLDLQNKEKAQDQHFGDIRAILALGPGFFYEDQVVDDGATSNRALNCRPPMPLSDHKSLIVPVGAGHVQWDFCEYLEHDMLLDYTLADSRPNKTIHGSHRSNSASVWVVRALVKASTGNLNPLKVHGRFIGSVVIFTDDFERKQPLRALADQSYRHLSSSTAPLDQLAHALICRLDACGEDRKDRAGQRQWTAQLSQRRDRLVIRGARILIHQVVNGSRTMDYNLPYGNLGKPVATRVGVLLEGVASTITATYLERYGPYGNSSRTKYTLWEVKLGEHWRMFGVSKPIIEVEFADHEAVLEPARRRFSYDEPLSGW